jgi:hypothetical protein
VPTVATCSALALSVAMLMPVVAEVPGVVGVPGPLGEESDPQAAAAVRTQAIAR